MERAITRRGFLKGAAMAAGGLMLAGVGVESAQAAVTFATTDKRSPVWNPFSIVYNSGTVEYALYDNNAYICADSGTYDGVCGKFFKVETEQAGTTVLTMSTHMPKGDWPRYGMTIHGVGYTDTSGRTQPNALCKTTLYGKLTNSTRSDHNVGKWQYFGEVSWWPHIVVSFNANTDATVTGMPGEQVKEMGTKLAVTNVCPKRPDALFRYWSLDAAGTMPVAPGQLVGYHDWHITAIPQRSYGWNDTQYSPEYIGAIDNPPLMCPGGTASNRVVLYAQWSRPNAPALSQSFS